MSLRFILGRSGSGKTTFMLDEIRERLKDAPDGPPIIYIVPEQMSFLSEYELVHSQGLSGMIRAQVYSFTRLAWRILQETGGASRNHIASAGLNMLIRKIIEDHKDDLKLFQQAADKSGFIQHVEAMLTEFKHYCVSPEELAIKKEEYAFGVGTRALGDKLHDLELVYKHFEDALSGKYLDGNDYLTLLAESVAKSDYLRHAEVYIDGFHSLTPQEYAVIAKLGEVCPRVSVGLVLDRPFKHGKPDDLHLFRMTGETYSKLYTQAAEAGISVEDDVFLYPMKRFRDESLIHLEENFHRRPIPAYQPVPSVKINTATNRRSELEGVARDIRELLLKKDYRYKDIAVLMRNGEEYADIIRTVFQDYQIPYFIDRKATMLNHPLIELMRSVLDVINTNWQYEPVFRAVKTDLLFPMDSDHKVWRERMDRLENYCLANGIKAGRWMDQSPWVYKRFHGLELTSTVQTDEEKELEAEINESRDVVARPILTLSKRLKKAKTGRGYCEALYLFLEELEIPDKLGRLSEQAEMEGNLILSREHDQAWQAVVDLLDQFVEILSEEQVTIKKFTTILDTGLEAMKFSLIPPAIDQVFVADVEKSRLSHVKIAFIIGMNDGVMPRKLGDDGVLSGEDRAALIEGGMDITPGGKVQLLDEDFVAYRAFTIASDSVYMSYPLANEEGKTLQPSPYLKRIKELFPSAEERMFVNDPSELRHEEQLDYISHPDTAISYLTTQLQLKKRQYPVAELWADVYNFYMENPEWKMKAERILSSLFFENKPETLSPETSRELYGEEILASVSRMEMFHGCPFSHFSAHGLKLREREVFKLEAPHIGDLFHGALKWIANEITRRNLSWAGLTKNQCEQLAHEAVRELAPKLQNQILLSSNRYFYIKRKLEQIIGKASYALSNQASSSAFTPVGMELEFGPGKELPPFAFSLRNGTRMQLQGRIDRVDKAEDESGVFLRILDYKSSERSLDLTEVYHGLALQMLTYLDIVVTHSEQFIGVKASPAGVLYFHVHNPFVDSKKVLTLEDIENEIIKSFRMKGLMLGDPEVVKLMDTSLEKGSSTIVPAGLKQDGSLSARSHVANEQDFALMQKHVRKLYEQAGNRIVHGEVDIAPYKLQNNTPCQFCSYKPVCQFDQSLGSNEYRMIQQRKPADIFHLIREEE